MIICICNNIAEKDMKEVIATATEPSDVHCSLGCSVQCGTCLQTIEDAINDSRNDRS